MHSIIFITCAFPSISLIRGLVVGTKRGRAASRFARATSNCSIVERKANVSVVPASSFLISLSFAFNSSVKDVLGL